jgi:uncharacterized protein YciI
MPSTRYYALTYDAVEGFREKRMPFRDAHLALVREAHARGEIVMAGAVGDPIDQALLVFRADSPDVAERFARADPYVTGLGLNWKVRPWHVVVGGDAP